MRTLAICLLLALILAIIIAGLRYWLLTPAEPAVTLTVTDNPGSMPLGRMLDIQHDAGLDEDELDEQWSDELGQMHAEIDTEQAQREERIAVRAELLAMEWFGIGDSDDLLAAIREDEQDWDAFLASGRYARPDWLVPA